MSFNSLEFLIFFPVVTTLYFLLPHRLRWMLLLTASCIFYMAFIPAYILVLLSTIVVDYWAGIWIERSTGTRRKNILIISIFFTCLILFVFKYFNFFNTNMMAVAQFLRWNYPIEALEIILPIGLSFHTFQSLSYVIEVYRGQQKAEHHFGIYALYVMFYPQLVAGPIERPQNLLHQFYEKHSFDCQRAADGLKLMAWGLFKKVVIADRLAMYVNIVYNDPTQFQGISFIVTTIFFAFQIYCDFSGYSDIAIGAAQVMGFKLMDNFNRPYFSRSIGEFWKRWHISLTSWFRDYVYIPLGGNRVAKPRFYFNLMITFLISGLWHGANWTFIIWGALNGFYLIFGMMTQKLRAQFITAVGLNRFPRVHQLIQASITFGLICFAWIFFRARDLSDALYIVTHLFDGVGELITFCLTNPSALNSGRRVLQGVFLDLPKTDFLIAVVAIIFMESVHLIQRHKDIRHMLSERPAWLRWAVYYVLIFSILVFGAFETPNQFIYFQF